MSKEEAYKVLRLSEGASFERVVQAKNKMLAGGGIDSERTMQVSDYPCRRGSGTAAPNHN